MLRLVNSCTSFVALCNNKTQGCPMIKVVKRDGTKAPFQASKIVSAVMKA
ncbi:MAG: ATP cone domain-containing protein, partial [Cetobacterium sp.]